VLSYVEIQLIRKINSFPIIHTKLQKEEQINYKEQLTKNAQRRKCSTKGDVLGKDQNKMLTRTHSGSQLIALSNREFRGRRDYAHIEVFTCKKTIQNQIQRKGKMIEVYKIEL
jgi:hypothetical protein